MTYIYIFVILLINLVSILSFININTANILRSPKVNLKIEKSKYKLFNISEEALTWNEIVFGIRYPDKEDIAEIYMKKYGEK